MHFVVLTILPRFFDNAESWGIIGRAFKKQNTSLEVVDARSFTENSRIDDVPFGGHGGMLLKYEPLNKAISYILAKYPDIHLLLPCPTGKQLNTQTLHDLSKKKQILIICGRYEGIDERISLKYCPEKISVGDYILSGAEIPAMLIIDGITRLLPSVLNNPTSLVTESFEDYLLASPKYTRPRVTSDGIAVPAVLYEGHHYKIKLWEREQRLKRTFETRKDLFRNAHLSLTDKIFLKKLQKDK